MVRGARVRVAREFGDWLMLTLGDNVLDLQGDAHAVAGPHYFTPEIGRWPRGTGVEVSIEVEEIDGLYERALALGIDVVKPIQDRPWKARDFRVADPDGYFLRFTTPLRGERAEPAQPTDSAVRRHEVEREAGADDPVGRVDDLADPQVDDDAREQVGLLGRDPVARGQPLDHPPDGVLGAAHEIGFDAGRGEDAAGGDRVGRALEGGARQSQIAPEREPEAAARLGLDGRAADLAVALACVAVAGAEPRALDLDREVDRRARDELADVDVAPDARGGTTENGWPGPAGQTPTTPGNGAVGTLQAERVDEPVADVPVQQAGLREVFGEEPEARARSTSSPRCRPRTRGCRPGGRRRAGRPRRRSGR